MLMKFFSRTHSGINNQTVSGWKVQGFLSHGSNISAGVIVMRSSDLQEQAVHVDEIIPGRMRCADINLHRLPFFSL